MKIRITYYKLGSVIRNIYFTVTDVYILTHRIYSGVFCI